MPTLSIRNQLLLGAVLLSLLVVTRGHHALSVDLIPVSTIGLFFLLGVYLRQLWVLTLAFVLVWTMDITGMTWSADTDFCLKDSYLFLLLSYSIYWAAGRLFAMHYAGETLKTLGLLAVIAPLGAALGYLVVSASFHDWSGLFGDALVQMFSDYFARLPSHLAGLAFYLVFAVTIHLALTSWTRHHHRLAHL